MPVSTVASRSGPARMTGRSRGALLVLCGAIFLEGNDVAMLNVALPSIRAELGMSTPALSMVVSAYVLGYAGFMLLGGRIADLFGRRRVFLASLGMFLVFSGLGGFSTEGWMLILARFVTGVAAAFMTPAGLSLITTNFPEGPQRNRAVLFYAATASAGFSLGLVAGGVLTAISWRWVFFAPVILTAIIFVLALRLIVDTAPVLARHRFDIAGAASMTGAMLLAAYGIIRLDHPADGLQWTLLALGMSALLWTMFLVIEHRSSAPLVRLAILRTGSLARANVTAVLFAAAFFGFQFAASLYLQELLGWTPLQTGLALLVIGIDAFIAPTLTPLLVSRFDNLRVIMGGLLLAALSYLLFLRISLDWTYAAMFPTMLLLGLSFALAYGPLTILATDDVAEKEQGLASALVNTSFQFGAALGLSAVSAVSVLSLAGNLSRQSQLDALQTALLVPVTAIMLGLVVVASGLRRRSIECRELA